MYELIIPGFLTAVTFILYVAFPHAFLPGFLGRFLGLLFQFMVFVVPFHLAALAAFATFERQGLDEKLKGTNAELRVWKNSENGYVIELLTLRQYASLLFGYLCAIGIIFIIAYIILSNIDISAVFGGYYPSAKNVVTLLVLMFVYHYAILSAYAITFLFDKVNKIGD